MASYVNARLQVSQTTHLGLHIVALVCQVSIHNIRHDDWPNIRHCLYGLVCGHSCSHHRGADATTATGTAASGCGGGGGCRNRCSGTGNSARATNWRVETRGWGADALIHRLVAARNHAEAQAIRIVSNCFGVVCKKARIRIRMGEMYQPGMLSFGRIARRTQKLESCLLAPLHAHVL